MSGMYGERDPLRITMLKASSANSPYIFGAPRFVRQSSKRCTRVVPNALQLIPCGDGDSEHLGGDSFVAPTIELVNGLFEVGRAEPADIVIPVPSVSGRHAMLRVDDERVNVTDLRSTNGTYIDGTEITAMQAYEVLPGSNIIFGDEHLAMYELVLVPDEEPAAEATPAEPASEGSA